MNRPAHVPLHARTASRPAMAHPVAPVAMRTAGATLAALSLLALATHAPQARAEAWGTVLSSTPIVVSAPVMQRECTAEPVPARREGAREPVPEGGIGAVAGAVMGAALGNAIGSGSGRALATGIGMIAGAALGNHAQAQEARDAREAQRQAEAQAATRCRDVTRYEARTVGYDVVYEYQGVQRSVRLAQAPGDRIPLQVQVVPAGAIDGPLPGVAAPAAPAAPPVYRQPAPVYDAPPAPRVYRMPGDNRVDDEAWRRADEAPPPPVVVREASNPVPYLIVGGITALAIAHAIRSDRPHRHPPRWRHR